MPRHLLLASTSRYKRALLERLRLPFDCMDPGVDETPREGEAPRSLARRLAAAKALAISTRGSTDLVIATDQVATCDGRIFGKPGDAATARKQLAASSGRTVHFFTAVCLAAGNRLLAERCVETEVIFRPLSEREITAYIDKDKPLDCAGSFRWESLGIALFSALRGEDPTALQGLPLIALTDMLLSEGINPLLPAS